MAQLRITQRLTGLKSNVASLLTEDSDLTSLLDSLRLHVHEALPLVADLEHAEAQSLVSITMEVGDDSAVADLAVEPSGDDRAGFIIFRVAVRIRNDLAWNHRDTDSPVAAFVQAVIGGLFADAGNLPEGGEFLAAAGISDQEAVVTIGSPVVLSDGNLLDGI